MLILLRALLVLAGAALALWAPRVRTRALPLLWGAAALAAALVELLVAPMPIWALALIVLAQVVGAALLARLSNRLALAPLLLLALPLGFLAFSLWARIAVGAVALLIAALLLWKSAVGMRVACAMLGAAIALPLPHRQAWAALSLVFLVLNSIWRGSDLQEQPQPRAGRVALYALAAGALPALGLLCALALARPLTAQGPRLQQLTARAPHGGLLWPLPSEALSWGPAHWGGFALLDNLDSVYLGGPCTGLWKLPGTSLRGAASLHRAVSRLRMIKDPQELAQLRLAAQATVQALREALPLVRAGAREGEIAAAIEAAARRHGCGGPSFPLIVAAGARAADAHEMANAGTLRAGDLLVTDIGCEANHYASDFTRTLPVGGRFDERQRKLYDAVYFAQQEAVRACRPGARLLGREGSLDAVARKAIASRGLVNHNGYGLGHQVGLFVHDADAGGPLAEGMVITIEPGYYLEGDLGIRIEDTYLVTAQGCELLTAGLPASPAEVEALLEQGR